MTAIRLFTDEDMPRRLALGLRAANIDAVSTPEAGRLARLDEEQLEWAATEGRALVSFNVGDFVRLHTAWMQVGKSHAGVIVSAQRPLSETLHRLLSLTAALDAETMRDRLEFLSTW
jgi:hypothetical protein